MERHIEGVVFDLFGTLVEAPNDAERLRAASALAACMDARPATVNAVLVESWQQRHDGTFSQVEHVARYLRRCCGARAASEPAIRECLAQLAVPRLLADGGVLAVLRQLRERGFKIGVLTDAAPEVADAWPGSALADAVDSVVFSCRTGGTKPDRRLYAAIATGLGVAAADTLYCGDGGGDELAGAQRAGMHPVRVRRRGGSGTLAFGERHWNGPAVTQVEDIPALLQGVRVR
ncbi:HAD family hydrolase [Longispora urticae]